MSDKENKTKQDDQAKASDAATVAVFRKNRKSRWLLFVVVGLILIGGVVVAAVMMQQQKASKTPVATTKDPFQEARSKAEQEAAQRIKQTEDARIKELQRLIAAETDKQKKADYYTELALIYMGRGDYGDAQRAGSGANDASGTAAAAALLGDIYYAKKDYAQAAKQYGIAMDKSQKTPSGERSPYNEYAALKKKAEDAQ